MGREMMTTRSQAMAADSEYTKSGRQSSLETTFVETDSESFRELVQKLTGVSEDSQREKLPVTKPPRSSKKFRETAAGISIPSDGSSVGFMKSGTDLGPRKPAFKLQDRRQLHRKLEINLGLTTGNPDPHGGGLIIPGYVLSPTFPALIPSPITPLGPDPFTPSSYCWNGYCYSPCSTASTPTSSNLEEQEDFSFQASPNARAQKTEPELLPLFPLHSWREHST